MRAHARTYNTCVLSARDQLFRNIAFVYYIILIWFRLTEEEIYRWYVWRVDENQNCYYAAITPAPNANTYLNINLDLSQRIFTHSK